MAAAALLTAATGMAGAQAPPAQAARDVPELPGIVDLTATVERPLFTRTRRPPQAPPPAPVADARAVDVPAEEAPAELTGIVSGPDRTYAILTSRASKEVHYLRKGETLEEWSLDEIGPRYVVLRRGPGSLRLELFAEKEAAEGAEGNRTRAATDMRPRFAPQQRQQQYRQQQQQQQQQRARQRQNRRQNRRADDE